MEDKKNKFTELKLSITRNLGNYESMKLEATWTPYERDTDNASVCKTQRQIEAAMNAAMVERVKSRCHTLNCDAKFRLEHKAEGERYPQLVTAKDADLLKSINTKIEGGTTIDTVFKFYAFGDDYTLNAVVVAASLNTQF